MKIVGGIYREICSEPSTDNLFGSGLRAAIAISQGCQNLSMSGLVESGLRNQIEMMSEKYGFKTELLERRNEIAFLYETPISPPRVYGIDGARDVGSSLSVSATNMLAFAMVETNLEVKADRLVIDPQGLSQIEGRITWTASHLAIVANRRETIKLLGIEEDLDSDTLAEDLRKKYNAEVSVIKCGALGSVVSDSGKIHHIGAYLTNRVNPVGSGDVFSGVFAYFWANLGLSPEEAANNASKATAEWVLRGPFQVVNRNEKVTAPNAEVQVFGKVSTVYLAAPFFTISERWLVNLCRNALNDLGAKVFSPLHDVGIGNSGAVAVGDIDGLNKSKSMIALLDSRDPGTLFEVGYGTAVDKHIVVYVSNNDSKDLTMIAGTHAHIHNDLSSAIYDAIWQGIQS